MTTRHPLPYATEVYRRMLGSVPAAPGERHAWYAADPYVLRHAADHACRASALDELLADPEFLVYADADSLNRLLSQATTDHGRLAGAVYRASFGVHRRMEPEQRRQILALDAARFRAPEFSRDLAIDTCWQLQWASAQQVSSTLVATLTGHLDAVRAVTAMVAPDGRAIAVTGDMEGVVRVWDLATGLPTAVLMGHTSAVLALASATVDGRPLAVSGSMDGTARVWDLATGTQLRRLFNARDTWVSAVATTSLDGQHVALTGDSGGSVKVWDLSTGRAGAIIADHPRPVTHLTTATVAGRPTVISLSRDSAVRTWDITRRERPGQFPPGHEGWVTAVTTLALDGRDVVATVGDDQAVRLWDPLTNTALYNDTFQAGHSAAIHALASTTLHGTPLLVTGSDDHTARVINVARGGRTTAVLRGHTQAITSLATVALNKQTLVVTGSTDRTVRVWDLTAGADIITSEIGHNSNVSAVAFATWRQSPVALSGGYDGTILLWDLRTGRTIDDPLPVHDRVSAMATANIRGRESVLVGGYNGSLRSWDLDTRASGPDLLRGRESRISAAATTTFEGIPLAVTGSHDGTITVWDLDASEALTEPQRHNGRVTGVAITGNWGVSCGDDRTLQVFHLVSGESAALENTDDHTITALAATVHGNQGLAVTGNHDGTTHVWDLAAGVTTHRLTGHIGPVRAVATSIVHGQALAVTGGRDRTVRVWDLVSGTPLTTWILPDEPRSLALAPDGTLLLGMGHELIAATLDFTPARTP
ncbi:WD40 repeat domain-containing protein [Streptacidiphilus sp. N1-3]|uniref:WD40 repeat domain-containing protein n=1 Tax=Streptacidiphilus alkalitolerans TaxID=3342712 RepID=A0ABV6XCZ5_9ACTN